MTLPATRLFRLKAFFWTVLAFNVVEYAAIGFFIGRIFNLSYTLQDGHWAFQLLLLLLLLLPAFVVFQAIFILNNYYPARAFSHWFRIFIISLCTLVILSSLFSAVVSFSWIMEKVLKGNGTISGTFMDLRSFFMAVGFLLASLWNLAAVIVLWRTMTVIRKNYRKGAWVRFESV